MKIEIIKGVVFNDGAIIGTYHPESNTLHCQSRISPRLYKPIAEAIGHKPKYDFGEQNPGTHDSGHPSPAAGMVSGEKPEPGVATPPHETPAAPSPEPPRDPRYGDKTPAWARWLRDTDPEAFEKRFAGRKLEI